MKWCADKNQLPCHRMRWKSRKRSRKNNVHIKGYKRGARAHRPRIVWNISHTLTHSHRGEESDSSWHHLHYSQQWQKCSVSSCTNFLTAVQLILQFCRLLLCNHFLVDAFNEKIRDTFFMPASPCSLLSSTSSICHGTNTMCALRSHSFLTVTHSKFMTQIFFFFVLISFSLSHTFVHSQLWFGVSTVRFRHLFSDNFAGVVSVVVFFPMSTTFNVFPFVSRNSSHFLLLPLFQPLFNASLLLLFLCNLLMQSLAQPNEESRKSSKHS